MNRTEITVIALPSRKELDLDVPADLPIGQLGEAILQGMEEWNTYPYGQVGCRAEASLQGDNWRLLREEATLVEEGILDGMQLRLTQTISYSTASQERQQAHFTETVPLFEPSGSHNTEQVKERGGDGI
ncbi:hypothetical protein FHS18_003066 [Paenibacillus phyllosphaerae]|uniref:Uncharacterized protein n=1 Tax=Paenibacillus phyllosphaerae TaxID=274593 RepID=A0A7W5FNB2_9BACL|nr:EsaB/YukD family protein [Paenibacillus phyllosphaerae]MBB3110998.1 hypothetical protein [Paenibacillus phyllosphaerae]